MIGTRVHITGSAAAECDSALLGAAHRFVRSFVEEVVARGGGLVLGVGGEVLGAGGEPCIFDWTILEAIATVPELDPKWPSSRRERFVVVGSQRGLEKVPSWREEVWKKCRTRRDLELSVIPTGWRMGGIVRERQVLYGDVLLVLGGGAGAEHLAELYQAEGKPVIAIGAALGAIYGDGRGGGDYLHGLAISNKDLLFKLREGAGSAASRLAALRLVAVSEVGFLASGVADLIADLQPPIAFYVRLFATDHVDFVPVERFFRKVVDIVVKDSGFTPREIGRGRPEAAFINVDIFRGLHRAGLVIVDLTGVRSNCTMELGYALGRRRRVVLSAKKGTSLPFDQDKIPTYIWDSGEALGRQRRAYRDWLNRNIDLPPLVE